MSAYIVENATIDAIVVAKDIAEAGETVALWRQILGSDEFTWIALGILLVLYLVEICCRRNRSGD